MAQSFWKPINVTGQGPSLSYLFFVDDLLLFSHANFDQINVVNSALKYFCEASGQLISQDKSAKYFSKTVDPRATQLLSKRASFVLVEDLESILGIRYCIIGLTR